MSDEGYYIEIEGINYALPEEVFDLIIRLLIFPSVIL